MALNPVWHSRIVQWAGILESLTYRPLGNIPMQGFFTHDQFTAGQARRRKECRSHNLQHHSSLTRSSWPDCAPHSAAR